MITFFVSWAKKKIFFPVRYLSDRECNQTMLRLFLPSKVFNAGIPEESGLWAKMRFKPCPILNFLSPNSSSFECHYITSSSGLEQKENWVATSFLPWIMFVVFPHYVQEHIKWCTLQMNDCVFNFRLWKGYNCWKNNVRFQKNHNSRSVQIKRST